MMLDMKVIRHQLQSCIMQRDEAAHKFQQCVGAISILEEQLKVIANEALAPKDEAGQPGKDADCGCNDTTPEEEKCDDCNEKGDAAVMDGEAKEQGDANGEVEQQEQVEAPKE